MANWEARRLAHNKAYEDRFTEDMQGLADRIGRLVVQAAPRPTMPIPNTKRARAALIQLIWVGVLKPYFIGNGEQPLDGAAPLSPYAELIVDGVRGSIAIQAERQADVIRKHGDSIVINWIVDSLRPTTIRELVYDPFHLFVYGDSRYKLSDRVWWASEETRDRIDAMLAYHIRRGTAAVDIADMLIPYMTYPAAQMRTATPYGRAGTYAGRRLARTEITAAAGRSTVNMAQANPYVGQIRWRLSLSHPRRDICDDLAGLYDPNNVPLYPAHPHCLCTLVPELVENPAAVTAQLREQILQRHEDVMPLQGAFNPLWIVGAILTGAFVDDVLDKLAA